MVFFLWNNPGHFMQSEPKKKIFYFLNEIILHVQFRMTIFLLIYGITRVISFRMNQKKIIFFFLINLQFKKIENILIKFFDFEIYLLFHFKQADIRLSVFN